MRRSLNPHIYKKFISRKVKDTCAIRVKEQARDLRLPQTIGSFTRKGNN